MIIMIIINKNIIKFYKKYKIKYFFNFTVNRFLLGG